MMYIKVNSAEENSYRNGKDGRRNGPPDVADPPEEEVRESSC